MTTDALSVVWPAAEVLHANANGFEAEILPQWDVIAISTDHTITRKPIGNRALTSTTHG